MSTILSNRQYPMLEIFVRGGPNYYMPIEDAATWDQRPFGSMYHRKWISYRPGKGFHATREGREAWQRFHDTDISRKDPTRPLSHYFDPTHYGFSRKPAKKVHEMQRSA